MKRFRLFLILSLVPLFSIAQQTINYTISVDTVQRDFILYVPASYTGDIDVPLVFSYHGLAGNAQNQMEDHDFRPVADTAGFIVAHPEGAPIIGPGLQGWNFGNDSLPDDVLFTSAMIDTIAADYNINLDRVYACGMSFGGYFSIYLAGQLSNRIASIASVAGTKLSALPDSLITPEERPVSFLEIHGTNDFNVPYEGNPISVSVQEVLDVFIQNNNCDTVPLVTQLPDTDPNDGSTVERFVYANGDEGTVVEHLKVTGGRHTWPDENTNAPGVNRDINGCEEIWKFFARYDINGAIGVITGIKQIESYSALTIYPNPANELINIETDKSVEEIKIFSALGQEYSLPTGLTDKKATIDISNLPSGIYFIIGKTDVSNFKSTFIKQ